MADPIRFAFNIENRDDDQLLAEVRAVGGPGFLGLCGASGFVQALFSEAPGPDVLAAVQTAVARHRPRPRGQRVAAEAVRGLLESPDPTVQGLVALLRIAFTLINDGREARGEPRLDEPTIIGLAVSALVSDIEGRRTKP